MQERGRGFERGSTGRGRSTRGRGNSAPATTANKKPPLQKQASNEGEEWETASESSDFLEKGRDSKNESQDNRDNRRDSKKSFSNQRPLNDRQNRRGGNNSEGRKSHSSERRSNKERSPNQKNGVAPPKSSAANGPTSKPRATLNHKENVKTVMRVDGIIPNDPNAINNALNSMQNKSVYTLSFL